MNRDACRSCGASIIWAPIAGSGKFMPLDAAPEAAPAAKLVAYNAGRGVCRVLTARDLQDAQLADPHVTFHKSHFATCPRAASWRRPVRP